MTSSDASKKILVIMSSDSELPLQNGKTHATGFYLNEFGVPAHRLVEAGHHLTIATPRGNRPPLDAGSDSKDYFKDEAEYTQVKAFVDKTLSGEIVPLADAVTNLDAFDAVFLPGGHAPMIELMHNHDLGHALKHFHERSLPTALICHAPVALLAAQPAAGAYQRALEAGETPTAEDFTYSGYKVTVFSTPEEKDAEGGFEAPMLYYPADALTAAGMTVQNGDKWTSNVVRDRELITGQNPMSDEAFVEEFLKALGETPAKG